MSENSEPVGGGYFQDTLTVRQVRPIRTKHYGIKPVCLLTKDLQLAKKKTTYQYKFKENSFFSTILFTNVSFLMYFHVVLRFIFQ